ncbi:MAG: hypothetical protein R3B84_00085 [Zavarzinella sp.]
MFPVLRVFACAIPLVGVAIAGISNIGEKLDYKNLLNYSPRQVQPVEETEEQSSMLAAHNPLALKVLERSSRKAEIATLLIEKKISLLEAVELFREINMTSENGIGNLDGHYEGATLAERTGRQVMTFVDAVYQMRKKELRKSHNHLKKEFEQMPWDLIETMQSPEPR